MRFTATTNRVIYILSSSTAVFGLLLSIVFHAPWWACLVSGAVGFGLTSTLGSWIIRRYVALRVRPLYRILLSRELITTHFPSEIRSKVDDGLVREVQHALDQLVGVDQRELQCLQQKERERSEFLSAIFHELRTPIFNIEGYTQTLLEGGLDDPEINRLYLERIIRSADRLADLVEDIDRISCYEAGGAVMYREVFDLIGVFREVLDTVIVKSEEKKIRYVKNREGFSPNEPVYVYADKLRISQLLEELLTNAIRYSPYDAAIHLSVINRSHKVLIRIQDHGAGIPYEDIPRLFEPFFRVDKSRSRLQGGPGLGLSWVKWIIDLHGEDISVDSQMGVGTVFSFTLARKS